MSPPLPLPHDIYASPIDFLALSHSYPPLAAQLKKKNRNNHPQLDFSDPESVLQLTKALLHRDFGLSLELPAERLCPAVPNRWGYVRWVGELVEESRGVEGGDLMGEGEQGDEGDEDEDGREGKRRVVTGVDVGTGASAIYPLLACRQHASWRFLVTEIDDLSASYARRNIIKNGLHDRIRFLPVDKDGGRLLPAALGGMGRIDFAMTNPPFYASAAELSASAKLKNRPPNSACTGAPVEMITPGGEVAFVGRLIAESMQPPVRKQVQWFSSMLGKLSSVAVIVERLKSEGCGNYAVTEFVHGQKTRRWAVAWSWGDLRPSVKVARGIAPGALERRLWPLSSEFSFRVVVPRGRGVDVVAEIVRSQVKALDLRFRWRAAALVGVGVGVADADVWSRKARRRRQREKVAKVRNGHNGEGEDVEMKSGDHDDEEEDEDEDEAGRPALVFKISLTLKNHDSDSEAEASVPAGVDVHVRWLQGRDAVLFESFCGWLKRSVTEKLLL